MWGYTPRQTAGLLLLADRRKKQELREQLMINHVAAQGDGEAIDKLSKQLG